MVYNRESRTSRRILLVLCALAFSTGIEMSTARAQEAATAGIATTGSTTASASAANGATAAATISAPEPAAAAETTALKPVDVHPSSKPAQAGNDPGRPYFIEFRARSAYNYGHAFVVHGHVNEPITKKSVVGLHPAGDSSAPWMLGHLIPVPSETGWSDGDVGYNDRYITAKYRVYLTPAEYRILLAKMRQMQATTKLWYAPVYNCVAFVGDIAAFLGMEHPFHLVMPKEYIEGIRKMNGGRTQLPSSWLASKDPNAARQQAAQLAAAHRQAQQQEPQEASQPAQQPPAVQQQAAPSQQQAAPAANTARRQRAGGTQASARQQEVPSYAAVH
jgi:hypothetical protein